MIDRCSACPDYSDFGHCGAHPDFLALPDCTGVSKPPLWCPHPERVLAAPEPTRDDPAPSEDAPQKVRLPLFKPTPEVVPVAEDALAALADATLEGIAVREGYRGKIEELNELRGTAWAQYQYDERLANCTECPLLPQQHTRVLAERPKVPENFSGLMVIGEAPGGSEVAQGRPFVGHDGRLFDQLLLQAGLNRAHAYITHAVMCQLPLGTKLKDIPEAVECCRPRLLTEIAHVKPRVTLGLGQAALNAITGLEQRKMKQVDFICPTDTSKGYTSPSCEGQGTRKRKVWGCAKCKKLFRAMSAETVGDTQRPHPDVSPCEHANASGVGCGSDKPVKNPPKWVARNAECLTCDGKKKVKVEQHTFKSVYSLGGNKPVAGGVFHTNTLATEHARSAFPEGTFFIPTYHPYLLRRPAATKGEKQIGGQFLASAAVLHYRKAARLLRQDPAFQLDWVPFFGNDIAQFDAWLQANPGPYSFDLETNAKEVDSVTQIKCCGIDSHATGKTCVLVIQGLDAATSPVVARLVEMLRAPEVLKVWQNGFGYDYPVLSRLLAILYPAGYVGDTLIRHSALYPDEPHNLQHIGFEFVDAPVWKPVEKERNPADSPNDAELWEYCATDVRMTTLSYQAMGEELARERVRQVELMDMRKAHMGLAMERNGLPIDREAQLLVGAQSRFEGEQALGFLRNYVTERGGVPADKLPQKREEHGSLFNPNSDVQLGWALYDPAGPCKLKAVVFSESGAPSASAEALAKYMDHPFVSALFEYRKATKLVSTYIDGIQLSPDLRLRARWNPVGARSGRYTTSPNVQNWPKWVRAMIKAAKGRVFIGSDYDQLELRILAAASGDRNLILRCKNADDQRKLEPEWDPHSYVSELALGSVYTRLDTKDPKHDKTNKRCTCETCRRKALRDGTKATVYGLNYGAGAEKILEQIITKALKNGEDLPPVDQHTVDITIKAYFAAFPDVKRFRDESLKEAEKTGYLREKMLGRYRLFPLREVPPTEAANFGIQAFAAAVMDWASWNVYQEIEVLSNKGALVAQIHDALYAEANEADAQFVADSMDRHLPCDVRVAGSSEWMPLTAKAVVGPTLKDVG